MIKLQTLKIERIDYNNINHLEFLKELMLTKGMNYLWDLSDGNLSLNSNKNNFIVLNELDQKIGYLNISDPTDAYYGITVSIYYAVVEKYQGNHYGQKIVEETNSWLFKSNNIECVIAQVDSTNTFSQNTLLKAGMQVVNNYDDYVTYIRRKDR